MTSPIINIDMLRSTQKQVELPFASAVVFICCQEIQGKKFICSAWFEIVNIGRAETTSAWYYNNYRINFVHVSCLFKRNPPAAVIVTNRVIILIPLIFFD